MGPNKFLLYHIRPLPKGYCVGLRQHSALTPGGHLEVLLPGNMLSHMGDESPFTWGLYSGSRFWKLSY